MNDEIFRRLTPEQQETVMKIAAEAIRQGVNPDLVNAIAFAESKYRHSDKNGVTTSSAGARGVMQIMPETAALYNKKYKINIDPDDEDSNIMGGVTIIKDLLQTYKTPRNAVALYNASPQSVRTFLDTYNTDPDKAILSLPVATQRYSIEVGKQFDLNDDNNTGLYVPLTAAELIAREPKVNQTTPDDDVVSPSVGAAAGAALSALGQIPFEPTMPVRIDQTKALEKLSAAKDAVELATRNLQNALPSGVSVADLEAELRLRQSAAAQADQELRAATEEARRLNRAPAPVAATIAETAEEIASRTKPGASGPIKWVRAMSDDVPDVLANQAANMRKDNPRGGQAIIDRDLAATQKIAELGAGDYKLANTPGGVQLQLPPGETARLNAELVARQEAERIAQIAAANQAEAQRLAQEQQLDQQRQAAQQRVEQARQERVATGQQRAEVERATRAATASTRTAQSGVVKAETAAELAARQFARASGQPGMVARPLEVAGAKAGRAGVVTRAGIGAIGGLQAARGINELANMQFAELLKRYEAGERSPELLEALQQAISATAQTGFGAAATVPVVGPRTARIKGAGAIGTLGMGLYEGYKALTGSSKGAQ